jgi:hypothetical protein
MLFVNNAINFNKLKHIFTNVTVNELDVEIGFITKCGTEKYCLSLLII